MLEDKGLCEPLTERCVPKMWIALSLSLCRFMTNQEFYVCIVVFT